MLLGECWLGQGFFVFAAPVSICVCGPHCKMALCHILGWWEVKYTSQITSDSSRPPGIHAGWLEVFWTSPGFYLLCRVELTALHLHPLRECQQGQVFFVTAMQKTLLMHGSWYKMVLCHILAWWEVGYLPRIPSSLSRLPDRISFEHFVSGGCPPGFTGLSWLLSIWGTPLGGEHQQG